MRKLLLIAILLLCFFNAAAYSDQPSVNAVSQGNQGYVYGKELPAVAAANTSSDDQGPIGDIIDGIYKIDSWIQKNLW